MSDRPIQRYTGNVPAVPQQGPGASIMTPQGPAVIQIIDMPSGGAIGPAMPGTGRKKPGGINVVSAVLRRWWLVVLVFAVVGGGAYFAGATLVKPTFEARAKVSFADNNPAVNGGGLAYTTVHRALLLINSREIPLDAWRRPEMAAQFPAVGRRNLDDPAEQATLLSLVKDFVDTDESAKGGGVIDIIAVEPAPEQARVAANAYAYALAKYCTDVTAEFATQQYRTLQEDFDNGQLTLKSLIAQREKLRGDNFEANNQRMAGMYDGIKEMQKKATAGRVALITAQAAVARLKGAEDYTSRQKLEARKFIDDEKAKDALLKVYMDQLAAAETKKGELLGTGQMTDQHPQVVAQDRAIASSKAKIAAREQEITALLEKKIEDTQKLQVKDTLEQAESQLASAQAELKQYEEQEAKLTDEQKSFAAIKTQVEVLEIEAQNIAGQNQVLFQQLATAKQAAGALQAALFKVEQAAVPMLKEDKRIKVQAGGLVGGLFLGILLALLVDKFDKRLRDPRDIEPLFGAALLGTIPRIQELKRVKGEQARNLIAEEFRIIRTQVLFGNPNLSQKLIAVTSPQPGDGKTSLSVNLAISIAKAGRRVLLIDGDLRKPDVHRVFNLSDTPGFAEVIQGSHEPGAVIKKSEVDGLEIMPAGTPLTRPSELLSRPEVGRILLALGELYDHIVLDTAPLLPVSDTHVLAGMMDGVIVSFNAEVDRDTIAMTQEILRRSRANIIGSVMNQVKYRQSGSYHRGKTAYDSYYNSPRGAKSDKLATVGKQ